MMEVAGRRKCISQGEEEENGVKKKIGKKGH